MKVIGIKGEENLDGVIRIAHIRYTLSDVLVLLNQAWLIEILFQILKVVLILFVRVVVLGEQCKVCSFVSSFSSKIKSPKFSSPFIGWSWEKSPFIGWSCENRFWMNLFFPFFRSYFPFLIIEINSNDFI